MIIVSLTDFIDYITKVGPSIFTAVNRIHSRNNYQAAFDYWKPLRHELNDFHINNKSKHPP